MSQGKGRVYEISGSECVTSMGGNVENGVSVLDGCSGRASILFGTSRAAVTNAEKGT